jgi:hypothetical protein
MIRLVRGIINGRKNIFALKRWIIDEDFLKRSAACDQLQNIGHSNPLRANARRPPHLPASIVIRSSRSGVI